MIDIPRVCAQHGHLFRMKIRINLEGVSLPIRQRFTSLEVLYLCHMALSVDIQEREPRSGCIGTSTEGLNVKRLELDSACGG